MATENTQNTSIEETKKRKSSSSPNDEPPSKKPNLSQTCPYLDTINKKILDFDFEKLCSVTLSNINVYGCLVCGKYFQGKGTKTPAYFHSLDANHHVFIQLSTGKVSKK